MSPYPISYDADFAEDRNRLTTFFRLVMVIPLVIVGLVYSVASLFATIAAWFALMFTGRYPQALYDFNGKVVRFGARLAGYFQLLTDAYPPFDLGEHPEYPIRISIGPAQESYDRVKVFFRIVVGIPVMLISYALGFLARVCTLMAWFLIVFTGRQDEGLQNAISLTVAHQMRTQAYFGLLTEDWPPFSPEGGPALGPQRTQAVAA